MQRPLIFSVAIAFTVVATISCKEYEYVDFCQPVLFTGTDGSMLSINASFNTTDSEQASGDIAVAAADFTLTIQPRVKSGYDMEDAEIEDNIESYIRNTYTERIKVPAGEFLPPSALPFFISYTLNAIRDISIVSDTDLFGILSGEDLSRCFVLAVPLDHPYSCMIFSDKEAGAYRSGISIDEYLRMEPMFAGPVCFRFAEEYADMIEAETVCRFTVALVLDNGSTVEGVSAGYRLIPSCGTCQR